MVDPYILGGIVRVVYKVENLDKKLNMREGRRSRRCL
jgi:hypothetical protein